MKSIPYGRQSVDQSDISAVVGVLGSDWLTQGPAIENFEKALARYCDTPYALAVANGTCALHLAYRALGLGAGDELWTSPNTFVATANAARLCGAEVDFVDIDPETLNLSVPELERKLERAKLYGRLPKIVVPVHFGGQPCDMEAIAQLARHYGFRVVEDAAHAIGATYNGHRVGSCTFSDAAVFSFHPVKVITTGEGGMVTTRDPAVAAAVSRLRSHGVIKGKEVLGDRWQGPWYYEQTDLGYNYRMTDIQAALGMSQLRRIDAFLARRRAVADRYDRELAALPVTLPVTRHDRSSALHLYVIQIDSARTPISRREAFDALRAEGILVQVHYIPVHTHPYYRALHFSAGDFPVAERYYACAISLPIYASLSDDEQSFVIEKFRGTFA